MNRRFLLKAVSVFVMCLFSMSASADHTWSNYHWARTANPFTLRVVDSVTPDWDPVLGTALSIWSASEVLAFDFPFGTDDSKKSRRRCRMIKGQMRVCNDSYSFNGWLGLATIGIDINGQIDRGTAKLNDSYSSYWTNPDTKNHVMCQEIGHLFGLGHTSQAGSCMNDSLDPLSQWPNPHDFVQLAIIYGGDPDLYNSYDTGEPPPEDDTCNAPPGKGCNKNNPLAEVPPMGIRVSRNGDSEVWVAPRNDGGLWIHHILLVPEN